MLLSSCEIDVDVISRNNILENYRIIAHAMGGIDNCDYLNVTEAMELHYNNGTRIFEVDLNLTEDGEWVGLHKIEDYNEYTNSNYNTIPSLVELKSKDLLGKYEVKTFEEILNVFNNYNDAYLILDTKFWSWDNFKDYNYIQSNFNSIISVIDSVDTNLKNRIIPQVFQEVFYNAVNDIGYFQYFLLAWVGNTIDLNSAYSFIKNTPNIMAISVSIEPENKNIDINNIYLYNERMLGIELPILLCIYIPLNNLKLSLLFGPEILFRFGEHKWYTENSDSEGVYEYKNLRYVFPGFISGVGLSIPISKIFFFSMEIRNELTLVKMYKEPTFKQGLNRFKFMLGFGVNL